MGTRKKPINTIAWYFVLFGAITIQIIFILIALASKIKRLYVINQRSKGIGRKELDYYINHLKL